MVKYNSYNGATCVSEVKIEVSPGACTTCSNGCCCCSCCSCGWTTTNE